MKRIVMTALCLALMLALVIPAWAAPTVEFTANSKFEVGNTVTVDEQKTLAAIMDSDSVTSDMYNAALERNVSYHWFKDGVYYSDGKSITLGEQDRGSIFYCLMALYSDMDCTQQCGHLESVKFSVPALAIQSTTVPTTESTTAPITTNASQNTAAATTVATTELELVDDHNQQDQNDTPWGLVAMVGAIVIGAMVLGFLLGRRKK